MDFKGNSIFKFLLILLFSFHCSVAKLFGGFSATSFKQLTSLKASHIKLIDDNTEEIGREFAVEKVNSVANEIDLKFREAIEFSRYMKTDLRTENFVLLKEIFEDDVKKILERGRLMTLIQAEVQKTSTAFAYDLAIQGECARPDGKCKTK